MDPKTRADCLPGGINSERPCKWSTCVYHYTNPGHQVHCLLDAYEEERTYEEIGEVLCVTKERARQLVAQAEWKVRKHLRVIMQEFSSL